MSRPGTYSLLCHRRQTDELTIGALGPITFESGWYVYTGSAFGPGGFSRITRHHEIADGTRDTRHWHIDYLLGASETAIETVYVTPETDCECAVAQAVPGTRIAAFGASDCSCSSHLAYASTPESLRETLTELHTATWPLEE